MSKHTLSHAVIDGTLSESAAYCGISAENIEKLLEAYNEALVVVRLRSSSADGRAVLSINDVARWIRERDFLVADGRRWHYDDIRDIFPIAL